jgi:hypothetical protein
MLHGSGRLHHPLLFPPAAALRLNAQHTSCLAVVGGARVDLLVFCSFVLLLGFSLKAAIHLVLAFLSVYHTLVIGV